MVLVGAFMLYKLAQIAARNADNTRLQDPIEYLWIGICLYTWFAPTIFARLISKELQQVRLKDDF